MFCIVELEIYKEWHELHALKWVKRKSKLNSRNNREKNI